jgi:hypothetical protein
MVNTDTVKAMELRWEKRFAAQEERLRTLINEKKNTPQTNNVEL